MTDVYDCFHIEYRKLSPIVEEWHKRGIRKAKDDVAVRQNAARSPKTSLVEKFRWPSSGKFRPTFVGSHGECLSPEWFQRRPLFAASRNSDTNKSERGQFRGALSPNLQVGREVLLLCVLYFRCSFSFRGRKKKKQTPAVRSFSV